MDRNVQYRIAWPPFSKSVIAVAVLLFACWLLPILIEPLGAFVAGSLVLSKQAVVDDLEIWSLLTHGFFERDFFGVLFAAFAVWIFGAEQEGYWGTTKWWLVQLSALLAGGVLTFLLLWAFDSALDVRGYHAAVFALVTAYCWRHWTRSQYFFFFEMTGRTMLLFFLGLGILLGVLGGYWPIVPLDLAGVAVGFLASGRTLNPRDLRVRFRNWRMRRKLSVVPKSPENKPNGKSNGKSNGMYLN